jgi:hypothetical protein
MATNVNSPFGFSPVRSLVNTYVAQPILCFVPAADGTALFIGDAVQLLLGVQDTLSLGVPCVKQGTAASLNYGIVVGIDPVLTGSINPPNLYINYRPASTAAYVLVQPLDENTIFKAQLSGASAYADIGKNTNLIVNAGNTVNGLSGFTLSSAAIATTNTLQFKILSASTTAGNVMASNYCVYEVVANISQFSNSQTGV